MLAARHREVYCALVVSVAVIYSAAAQSVATKSEWTRPPHNLHVVCYVGTWANYRPAPANFLVENIDPSLCSHLMYSFVGLDNNTNTIKSLDPWTDLDPPDGRGFFKQMTGLREKHPHLKVLLAVGGFNEGSESYSQMASTAGTRRTFIKSSSEFVRKHNFDGLDIDWEFPTKNGGMPEDRNNFVSLAKEMRAEFDKYGLMVTAAFAAGVDTMAVAYDLPAVAEHLDLLNIMAYDYHGSWDQQTGSNAPLYAQSDAWSVEDTLIYIRDQGVPLEKVVLGLGMYGHTFLLVDPEAEGSDQLGAPCSETGFAGPFTKQDGFMGYNEICLDLADPAWKEYWDNSTGTPYLVNGDKVVSYDNEQSIALKVDYAVRFNLGGLMLWSIDTDDFQGDCGGTTFPLLTKLNKVVVETLEDMGIDPTATPETTPTTTTTAMSTTTDPSTEWTRPPHNLHVVCYVGTWANYRPAPANFLVESIDARLCSHLMYSFVGLDSNTNTIKSLDPWTDLDPPDGRGFFKQMTGLREKHPHLKVLLAVGGFNEGSESYSQMASTTGTRRTFIKSSSEFVRKHNFDGLDIDWEFPTKNGGMPEDRDNFVSLVKEMRAEFDKYGLMVTAAFAAGVDTMAVAYDLPAVAEHLDLLNIMAYDYHGSWDQQTGSNAPLYAQSDAWSVEDTLIYIRDQGVPLEKVVLGLGMYGHTFLLVDPEAEGSDQLGAPCSETGFAGPFTKQDGFMGYNEICLDLADPALKEYWDNSTATPYLVNGDKVVSYDNEQSIALKVDYAVRFNLGGLMLWSIDTDDFQGDCGGTTFPLLTKLNKVVVETLEDMGIDPTATPETTPTTTTTAMSTTADPSAGWSRPPHNQPMICYVSTWANYRDKPADFYVKDIQPSLCSHLVYAFAGLDNKTFTIKSLDPNTDLDKPDGRGGFKLMTGLKKVHPHLKVLLAIGGFNEGSESYSQLAASPSKRKVFVLSVVTMLKQYGFDGLDFDWEFPGERGGVPEDKINFVTLMQDLRKEFDKTGGLMLTAALHAGPKTMDVAYNLPALSQHLDLLHIMAYDYHGSFDKKTGSNAPLYAQADGLSVVDTLEYLKEKGARLDKVVLGLPMYGHTFVMTQPEAEGSDQLGAPSDDIGFPGPYTKQAGFMGFHEVCLELSDPGWDQYWDNGTGTPYIINGEQVVSYDDEHSLTLKVDYALRFGVAGFMTWSIDTDDFQGDCGDKRYPLMKRINLAIVDTLEDLGNDTTTTTQEPTESTSVHPTTTDPTDEWHEPPHDLYMVCYVSTWARYRVVPAGFVPTDIDARLCTHLMYAFAGLDNKTYEIVSLDPYADEDSGLGMFKNMTGMRKEHPHLKIMLGIGGFGEGSEKYSIMAASPEKRQTFVNSTLLFLLKYDFDGLDLDWEYPGERGGSPDDRENFVLLIQELRAAFATYDLLLTAALNASPKTMETAYNLAAMSKHLDLLHIMAYDYHGSFDKKTGSNAPLYAQADGLSVEDTLNYLKENGVPMEIVVLGLPMYGHTFIMTPPGSEELGAPAKETGFAGEYTQEDGFMGYHEICLELTDEKWTTYWDNDTATPYAIQGDKLISYDDAISIALKVDYAVRFGVGGFMMWSIDTDDFQGHCDDTRYPLLKTINSAVVETFNAMATTTTRRTTDSSTSTTTKVTLPPTSGTTSAPQTTTPGAAVTAHASSLLLVVATTATLLRFTAS